MILSVMEARERTMKDRTGIRKERFRGFRRGQGDLFAQRSLLYHAPGLRTPKA
jgi:hypothetical protein